MYKRVLSSLVAVSATLLNTFGCTSEQHKTVVFTTSPLGFNATTTHAKASPVPDRQAQDADEMPVRGQIDQTFQLSSDARVDVTGVEGPIEVETTDSSTAEIHLTRFARTQADYDCDKIIIQHTLTSLVVKREQERGHSCQLIHARERMRLVVPRTVDLSLKHIEGDLTIGITNGMLRLEGIEGQVSVAQARAAQMRSLEKGLSLTVAGLKFQGISISEVEGAVELGVTDDLNADLKVDAYEGDIKTEISNAQVRKIGSAGYRVRIGAGGADILLSRIEGAIRIHRA
jgi:hypothetical protein